MKQSLYLIAYVIIIGVILEVATGWDEGTLPVIFSILAVAFFGWFFVLGMIAGGDKKKSGIDISKKGLKLGAELLGGWLLCVGILVVLGVAWAVILLLYKFIYNG